MSLEGNVTNNNHTWQEILEDFITQFRDDKTEKGYVQQDGATAHLTDTTVAVLREFDNQNVSRSTENTWLPTL